MELYYPASLYCPRAVYEVAYASRLDLGDAIHACVQATSRNASVALCPSIQVTAALLGGLSRKPTIRAGRTFKVRIQVSGAANGQIQQTAVALALPEGVEYRKSGVRPRIQPSSGANSRKGRWVQQRSGVVFWPGTPSQASKTYTYTASLKVGWNVRVRARYVYTYTE